MDVYIGTVMPWPIAFAPSGWELCHGQLLPINQYQGLYSIIGTMYGGDGRTTFALPDLRGRQVVGASNDIHPGQIAGSQAKAKSSDPADAIVQPSLAMNYIIALSGYFPSPD